MIDHDKGLALVMRSLDIDAQLKELKEEKTKITLDLKDYLNKQNDRKCKVGGYYVKMVTTRGFSFSKTRLVAKYGPSVMDYATHSESTKVEIKEMR